MGQHRFWPRGCVLRCASMLVIGSALSACGGGGGRVEGAAPDLAPMSLPTISQQPASVSIAEGAKATFAVQASANATLQWQRRDSSSAPWEPIADATAATYTLEQASAADRGAEYRVVATNSAGSAASVAAVLNIAERTWQPKVVLEANEGTSSTRVAFDPAGNAIAVWAINATNGAGNFGRVAVRRLVDGEWQPLVNLAIYSDVSGGLGLASDAQVGVAADGSAIALWHANVDATGESHVWTRRFTPESGWSEALRLGAHSESSPAIAVNAAGQAIAAWRHDDTPGGPGDLWAARYVPGAGWQTPLLAETQPGTALAPEVAIDDSGNAMLAWLQKLENGTQQVWVRRHRVANGWEAEKLLEANAAPEQGPRLAVSANGDAFAIWSRGDPSGGSQVWSSRFAGGCGCGGWSAARRLDRVEGRDPHIVVDAAGNAMALWTGPADTNSLLASAWADRYDATSGWAGAQRLSGDRHADAFSFTAQTLAADPRGNVLALWGEVLADGSGLLRASRFVPAFGWGDPVTLESDEENPGNLRVAFGPSVALAPSGVGAAVWSHLHFRSGAEVFGAQFK